jgi:ubiquitin-small subunit ribosomal protein S27Ae
MADDKKGAGKKPAAGPKRKPGYKISKIYEVSGAHLGKKNKTCPKCGPGVFMANHKDRWTCGKCKYSEKK